MLKQIVCASVGVAVWAAVAAEGGSPRAELLGSLEVSSFSDFQQKVVDFGTTIKNPAVSLMAVPAVQNALTEKFGRFRPDDPMKLLCYADVPAVRKALAGLGGDGIGDAVYPVFLYPCAEGPEKFLENHPEAQKKADGTIELEDGNVLLYSADGRTCAFSTNARFAKRALANASFSRAAARPLIRLDVTEAGLGLFADMHQKLLEMQDTALQAKGKPCHALLASFLKLQRKMGQLQNAKLRSFAHVTLSVDLDETGFVVKGGAKTKPGAPFSLTAGFRLPAGALDAAPAGAPLIFAGSYWGYFANESQYKDFLGDLNEMLNAVSACSRDCPPPCAAAVAGLCTAGSDLLNTDLTPAPTDWFMGALAFGPKQEPYLVGHATLARANRSYEASSRFCAAVAAAIEKSWPGILRAQGASLTVNWFRLVDVIAEATEASPKDRQEAEKVKAAIAGVVGGPESVFGSELTSPTTMRSYAWAKGFTPPAAAGGSRVAAALPEIVAERPTTVFYLSLYSLVRDNVLPLAVRVFPKQKSKNEIQSLLNGMPPPGANSAIAFAEWDDRDGARFVIRVTKDEIRNIAAAVNAVMAAQSAE